MGPDPTVNADPAAPRPPGLDFAFTIEAQIGVPLSGGRGVNGERLHIAITGGTVKGPMLEGTIVAGGSDWPLIRPDGTSEISAHYTILAGDGTPIYVRNRGLRVSSADVLARLRAGERVDPGAYYFRSVPQFDAPDGPHGWLRGRIFVARLEPGVGSIIIHVFVVQ